MAYQSKKYPGKMVRLDRRVCCNVWHEHLVEARFDAATRGGAWGYLCPEHYAQLGTGLGIGRGQILAYAGEDEDELFEKYSGEEPRKKKESTKMTVSYLDKLKKELSQITDEQVDLMAARLPEPYPTDARLAVDFSLSGETKRLFILSMQKDKAAQMKKLEAIFDFGAVQSEKDHERVIADGAALQTESGVLKELFWLSVASEAGGDRFGANYAIRKGFELVVDGSEGSSTAATALARLGELLGAAAKVRQQKESVATAD